MQKHRTKQRARRIVLMSVGMLSLIAGQNCRADDSTPPNIVLIVADDLGYGELGCYGQKWIKTPRIDQLADEGIMLTQFYSGSPVCAPSRCVLMTGRHPGHAYIRDNGEDKNLQHLKVKYGWEYPGQRPIPNEEVTIAEMLKQRGYVTGAMGKWGLGHFGTSGDPNTQGFDLFFGYNCQWHAHNHYPRFLWRNAEKVQYPGNDGKSLKGKTFSQDEFTREALQFVRDHKNEPFFLYLPFAIPHLSIQGPDESLAEYQGKIPEEKYDHHGYLEHPSPRAGYAAMITHMDRDIGRIVDLIDDLELTDDTLFIFTSDNGPTYNRLGGSDSEFFNSAPGMRGMKGSVYEGGLRVPLVARWKGQIEPGTSSDILSAFWDLMPTLSEAAKATVPEEADGVSLLPTFTGTGKQAEREYLVWEFGGYGGQQAIRKGDWKGVRQNTKKGKSKLELYNLRDDPAESNNVASEHPEVVKQLEHILETDRTESEIFPLFGKAG
ncbi:MAG: arylsulfatase [Aeoliella sp.]